MAVVAACSRETLPTLLKSPYDVSFIHSFIDSYSVSAAIYPQLCPASRLGRQPTRRRRYVTPSHFILVYKNHLSPGACCFPLTTIYINLSVHLDNDCTLKTML